MMFVQGAATGVDTFRLTYCLKMVLYRKGVEPMSRQILLREPQHIELAENQILSVKGRPLEILCLSGRVWVTDGVGGERIIQRGQRLTLNSKGKICLQAFEPSLILMQLIVKAMPVAPLIFRIQAYLPTDQGFGH
jgi:hypothetical protein